MNPDSHGNLHDTRTGQFAGRPQAEADPAQLGAEPTARMSAEDHYTQYAPLEAPGGAFLWKREEIEGFDPHLVWTVVERPGADRFHVVAGIRTDEVVVGYSVTAAPWTDETTEADW